MSSKEPGTGESILDSGRHCPLRTSILHRPRRSNLLSRARIEPRLAVSLGTVFLFHSRRSTLSFAPASARNLHTNYVRAAPFTSRSLAFLPLFAPLFHSRLRRFQVPPLSSSLPILCEVRPGSSARTRGWTSVESARTSLLRNRPPRYFHLTLSHAIRFAYPAPHAEGPAPFILNR